MPVNLLDLNMVEFKQFLDSFDHVFSDCDGVIWSGGPLPGSADFYKLVKQLGKSVNFVSNNSMRSEEEYNKKFAECGISKGFSILTTPSTAILEYLKSIDFKKKVYCVTGAESIKILKKNGIKCEYGPDQAVDLQDVSYLTILQDDPEIGAVVFDSDYKINIAKVNKAITYLRRPDVVFINGATDTHVPLAPGVVILGSGPFINIVSEEVNRKPILLGKPSRIFGQLAMKRSNVTDASRVLFIGDMIEQDVALGKATGFKTLLVLTNLSKGDMDASIMKPDYYSTCLGDLVPKLKSLLVYSDLLQSLGSPALGGMSNWDKR